MSILFFSMAVFSKSLKFTKTSPQIKIVQNSSKYNKNCFCHQIFVDNHTRIADFVNIEIFAENNSQSIYRIFIISTVVFSKMVSLRRNSPYINMFKIVQNITVNAFFIKYLVISSPNCNFFIKKTFAKQNSQSLFCIFTT